MLLRQSDCARESELCIKTPVFRDILYKNTIRWENKTQINFNFNIYTNDYTLSFQMVTGFRLLIKGTKKSEILLKKKTGILLKSSHLNISNHTE